MLHQTLSKLYSENSKKFDGDGEKNDAINLRIKETVREKSIS